VTIVMEEAVMVKPEVTLAAAMATAKGEGDGFAVGLGLGIRQLFSLH
jgi:hypothetical protein